MASSLTLTEIEAADLPSTAPTGKGIMFLEESTGDPFIRDDSGVDTPMTPGGVNISHELLLNAESTSDQVPTGLDSTTQVEFGAAQGSVSDPIMIDVNGLVTINEAIDSLSIFTLVSFGRTGGVGTSRVFFRSVVTIGALVIESTPIFVEIDNANAQQATFTAANLAFPAGTTLAIEFVRDSSGNDSGSLLSETPLAAGWTTKPSASASMLMTRTIAT